MYNCLLIINWEIHWYKILGQVLLLYWRLSWCLGFIHPMGTLIVQIVCPEASERVMETKKTKKKLVRLSANLACEIRPTTDNVVSEWRNWLTRNLCEPVKVWQQCCAGGRLTVVRRRILKVPPMLTDLSVWARPYQNYWVLHNKGSAWGMGMCCIVVKECDWEVRYHMAMKSFGLAHLSRSPTRAPARDTGRRDKRENNF